MISTLLIIGCLVSKTIGAKRYDVEAEALKLYGEDIHDVIAKFRRTPDYLRILESKVEALRTRMNDIIIQTHYYYDQKLKEKVADLFGIKKADRDQLESPSLTTPADVNTDTTIIDKDFIANTIDSSDLDASDTPEPKRPPLLSFEFWRRALPEIFSLGAQLFSLKMGRNWVDSVAASNTLSEKFFRGSGVRYRRKGESKEEDKEEKSSKQKLEEEIKEQKERVKILDSYHKLSSHLTLAQRNSMKDLGFEFSGHLIHSLIRSMGADDTEEKSTKHPFGGDTGDSKTTPTTRHVSVHEVTTLPSKPPEHVPSTPPGAVASPDSRFVFK